MTCLLDRKIFTDLIVGDLGMTAVAEWWVSGVLAAAKVGLTIGFGGEGFGVEIGTLVGAIAEGLVGRFSAGAEVICLPSFEIDGDGLVSRDYWFVHGCECWGFSGKARPEAQP